MSERPARSTTSPAASFPLVPLGAIPAQRRTPDREPVPAPARGNGFGTAALVLAVVGLLFGLVPLTGFIACSLAALAVVFGVLGAARARTGQATNPGTSITGAALGTLALLLGIWGVALTLQAAAGLNRNLGALGFDGQPVAPAPPAGGQIAGNGTFLVGTDIQPGTYRTAGPAAGDLPNCYWARSVDASGDVGSILANENSTGPTAVTIKPDDRVFESDGCQAWTKVG